MSDINPASPPNVAPLNTIFFSLNARKRKGNYPKVKTCLLWNPWSPQEITIWLYWAPHRADYLTLSRELLCDGLDRFAGLGAITLFPHVHDSGQVEIVADLPHGRIGVLAPRAILADFVQSIPDIEYDAAAVVEDWLRAVGHKDGGHS